MKPIDRRSDSARISKTLRLFGTSEVVRVQVNPQNGLAYWNYKNRCIKGIADDTTFAPNRTKNPPTFKRQRRPTLKNGFYLKDVA